MTKNRMGSSSGIVIRVIWLKVPAPSISAASYSSRGMSWIPVEKMTKFRPTEFQMSIRMTRAMAYPGVSFQIVLAPIPIFPRLLAIRPVSAAMYHCQIPAHRKSGSTVGKK